MQYDAVSKYLSVAIHILKLSACTLKMWLT